MADGPVGSDEVAELAVRLDVRLRDPGLLAMALVHRSWAFEHGRGPNNERLEFLGDAVLGLVVTDVVYHAHPDEPEGRLAKVRSAAVKTASLAEVARGIPLGPYLRLGRGESDSGGADKDSILADGLEAVLGAIYLDQGFDVASRLVRELFGRRLSELASLDAALDYKTSLQELTAARFGGLPRYEVTDSGPDHAKQFRAQVTVDGEVAGHGEGPSKKHAEQQAARHAYHRLAAMADD